MKPFLLMERVGVNESVAEKARRRGQAMRKFARQRRTPDGDTVGQVGARRAKGMTREQVAEDPCLHFRDMQEWEARAAQRRWERETQERVRQAFAAE